MKKALLLLLSLLLVSCSQEEGETTFENHYKLDDASGVISRSMVNVDPSQSSDGGGSLMIQSNGTTRVKLFELASPGIDNTDLQYLAKMKSEDLQGRAYLEMLVSFPGKGEFFSRSFDTAVGGTSGWSTVETSFRLKPDEFPEVIKLNLVVEGSGTVWVDDMYLRTE